MRRIVRLLILLLVPLRASAQQDVVAHQYKLLTNPNGWAVHTKHSIARSSLMKDLLADLTPCHRSDQLVFKTDGTYERNYYKKDCADTSLKNTKGTWTYDVDLKIWEGIIAIHLKDQVDPSLSADYTLVWVDEHLDGGLILSPLPDQATAEKAVVIYKHYKGPVRQQHESTASTTIEEETVYIASDEEAEEEEEQAPSKPIITNSLLLSLLAINNETLDKAGKDLDEVFATSLRNEEVGILEYDNKETGTGPYYLIHYKGYTNEEYLMDIQTDYTGSRLAIYLRKDNAWKESTQELIGHDFEKQNVKRAFAKWLSYTQASVTLHESEQNFEYSLPPDNFLKVNPDVMVVLNVKWVDSKNQEKEDGRVVAEIKFDGQKFVWSWSE